MHAVTVLSVFLTSAILAFVPPSGSAQEQSVLRLLRPTSGTVARAGLLEIAAIVSDTASSVTFALDGKPIAAGPLPLPSESSSSPPPTSATMGLHVDFNHLSAGGLIGPVWLAVRLVEPGEHEITIGKERVRFVAVESKIADDRTSGSLDATSPTIYVAHPPALPGQVSCTTCHVLNRQASPALFEDMSTVVPPRTPDVCFQCHEREKFEPTHAHRVEHLMFCQMCHDPHGASRPALMKIAHDEACGKCHE